ncbi:hypothetical protein B5S28_g1876 [[Candida] boidinii]|nr:hypothetical protein B5S28_g1876 [[Candida] boidinii]OWB61727.1 hypothetical protein B5S29_g2630 [[Candida] boidinii]OWB76152.1 hypothetical protein B5S32_g302 [[Candida] boidinii]
MNSLQFKKSYSATNNGHSASSTATTSNQRAKSSNPLARKWNYFSTQKKAKQDFHTANSSANSSPPLTNSSSSYSSSYSSSRLSPTLSIAASSVYSYSPSIGDPISVSNIKSSAKESSSGNSFMSKLSSINKNITKTLASGNAGKPKEFKVSSPKQYHRHNSRVSATSSNGHSPSNISSSHSVESFTSDNTGISETSKYITSVESTPRSSIARQHKNRNTLVKELCCLCDEYLTNSFDGEFLVALSCGHHSHYNCYKEMKTLSTGANFQLQMSLTAFDNQQYFDDTYINENQMSVVCPFCSTSVYATDRTIEDKINIEIIGSDSLTNFLALPDELNLMTPIDENTLPDSTMQEDGQDLNSPEDSETSMMMDVKRISRVAMELGSTRKMSKNGGILEGMKDMPSYFSNESTGNDSEIEQDHFDENGELITPLVAESTNLMSDLEYITPMDQIGESYEHQPQIENIKKHYNTKNSRIVYKDIDYNIPSTTLDYKTANRSSKVDPLNDKVGQLKDKSISQNCSPLSANFALHHPTFSTAYNNHNNINKSITNTPHSLKSDSFSNTSSSFQLSYGMDDLHLPKVRVISEMTKLSVNGADSNGNYNLKCVLSTQATNYEIPPYTLEYDELENLNSIKSKIKLNITEMINENLYNIDSTKKINFDVVGELIIFDCLNVQINNNDYISNCYIYLFENEIVILNSLNNRVIHQIDMKKDLQSVNLSSIANNKYINLQLKTFKFADITFHNSNTIICDKWYKILNKIIKLNSQKRKFAFDSPTLQYVRSFSTGNDEDSMNKTKSQFSIVNIIPLIQITTNAWSIVKDTTLIPKEATQFSKLIEKGLDLPSKFIQRQLIHPDPMPLRLILIIPLVYDKTVLDIEPADYTEFVQKLLKTVLEVLHPQDTVGVVFMQDDIMLTSSLESKKGKNIDLNVAEGMDDTTTQFKIGKYYGCASKFWEGWNEIIPEISCESRESLDLSKLFKSYQKYLKILSTTTFKHSGGLENDAGERTVNHLLYVGYKSPFDGSEVENTESNGGLVGIGITTSTCKSINKISSSISELSFKKKSPTEFIQSLCEDYNSTFSVASIVDEYDCLPFDYYNTIKNNISAICTKTVQEKNKYSGEDTNLVYDNCINFCFGIDFNELLPKITNIIHNLHDVTVNEIKIKLNPFKEVNFGQFELVGKLEILKDVNNILIILRNVPTCYENCLMFDLNINLKKLTPSLLKEISNNSENIDEIYDDNEASYQGIDYNDDDEFYVKNNKLRLLNANVSFNLNNEITSFENALKVSINHSITLPDSERTQPLDVFVRRSILADKDENKNYEQTISNSSNVCMNNAVSNKSETKKMNGKTNEKDEFWKMPIVFCLSPIRDSIFTKKEIELLVIENLYKNIFQIKNFNIKSKEKIKNNLQKLTFKIHELVSVTNSNNLSSGNDGKKSLNDWSSDLVDEISEIKEGYLMRNHNISNFKAIECFLSLIQ